MSGRVALVLLSVAGLFASTTAAAGAQDAVVMCGGEVATIVGTSGANNLIGTEGDDVITGLQGNDFINGMGGDDIICGGLGNDVIRGGLGFDIIYGAQGNDTIYARGTDKTQTVTRELGGGWTEEITFTDSTDYPPLAYEDTRGARIFGGAGDDKIYGSDRWDRIQGGPGHDGIWGFQGNDWIRGGPGHDSIYGHQGKDDLGGGTGNDWLAADRADTAVRAGAGKDKCPTITSTVKWRGCKIFLETHRTIPTLPALAAPAELSEGPADWFVYWARGFGPDREPYWGVTNDLLGTQGQLLNINEMMGANDARSAYKVDEINQSPLTEGQARAVATLYADLFGEETNEVLLDPNLPYYDEAMDWALKWFQLNPSRSI